MNRMFALAAVLLVCSFAVADDTERKLVATFKGRVTEEGKTAAFKIGDDWALKWEQRGKITVINVVKKSDDSLYYRAHKLGDVLPESGLINIPDGGEYYLLIYGDAHFKITVWQNKGF